MDERDRRPLKIGTRDAQLPASTDRTAFFLQKLEDTIIVLTERGKKVVLVYPMPEAGMRLPDTILRMAARGAASDDITLHRELFDARTARIIEGYDRIVAEHDVLPIRLDREFCGRQTCTLTFEDGIPIYRDTNHLNATAARRLAPLFDPVFVDLAERENL